MQLNREQRRAAGKTHAVLVRKSKRQRHHVDPRAGLRALDRARPFDPCDTVAQPVLTDAYVGAREDLAIWKKRALEAEALNRKFAASVNSPSFMGEPAAPIAPAREPLTDSQIADIYFEVLGSQHLREQDRKMVMRFARAIEHHHGITAAQKGGQHAD